MSDIVILNAFKKNLVQFIDELIVQLPKDEDLIIFRFIVNDQILITDMMDYFTTYILPIEDMVDKKDENFFLKKFNPPGLSNNDNKSNKFKKIWESGLLDKSSKDTIWKWFKSFIVLGKKYLEVKS